MLRLVDIATSAVVFEMPDDYIGWVALPNGNLVSPATAGWEGGGVITYDEEGKAIEGPALYRIDFIETPPEPEVDPVSWPVQSRTVVSRVAEAGKVTDFYEALTKHPRTVLQFFTGDVYSDDSALRHVLEEAGLNPEHILARL